MNEQSGGDFCLIAEPGSGVYFLAVLMLHYPIQSVNQSPAESSRSNHMKCHGFEALADYVEQRLASAEAKAIAAHLELGCARCSADVSWYQTVRAIAEADDLIEPPPWVLKRALRIFETRTSDAGVLAQVARAGKLIAQLVFDSMQRPAIVGARSGAAEARQLLYRADEFSIDLQFAFLPQDRVEMTGQLLREGDLRFESVALQPLQLMRAGRTVFATLTNERGEFVIGQIEPGSYSLNIDVDELSITIFGLPIAQTE